MTLLPKLRRIDPVLGAALAAALVFSVHGSNWGRVECWNPDQIALRRLNGLRPASGYLKPPFHTNLTHVLVVWPANRLRAVGKAVTGRAPSIERIKFVGAHALTIALFLGTVAIGYSIAAEAFGRAAGRTIALLLATSAGLIAYNHFLTADSPLLFWMLLAFRCSQQIISSPAASNYLLAGCATGLATATKYNGLAVGIAIPIAHLLSSNYRSVATAVLDRRLLAGLIMVPIGFLAGAPSVLLEPRKFYSDFLYNYAVTPRYSGESGSGYFGFIGRVPELIGWPGAIFLAIAAALSLRAICSDRSSRPARAVWLLALAVALLYFAKIGQFPRTETRFVLPVIPFALLLIGPALSGISKWKRLAVAVLLPLLIYNATCSWLVGTRFASDARLAAQDWIVSNGSPIGRIESSFSSPHWAKLAGVDGTEIQAGQPEPTHASAKPVLDIRMPYLHRRAELFAELFHDNALVAAAARGIEGAADQQLFTMEALQRRHPTLVAVHSLDCTAPVVAQREYYRLLLSGDAGYAAVFDKDSPPRLRFTYPRELEAVGGRITILARATR